MKTIILIFSVPKSQNSNEEEKNHVSNHGDTNILTGKNPGNSSVSIIHNKLLNRLTLPHKEKRILTHRGKRYFFCVCLYQPAGDRWPLVSL